MMNIRKLQRFFDVNRVFLLFDRRGWIFQALLPFAQCATEPWVWRLRISGIMVDASYIAPRLQQFKNADILPLVSWHVP